MGDTETKIEGETISKSELKRRLKAEKKAAEKVTTLFCDLDLTRNMD